MKKGYLILENGKVFEGELIGAEGSFSGEIVFNTSVCGYTETVTDPAFSGQIVVNTFSVTGAYGVNRKDAESEVSCGGFVAREVCSLGSNFRMELTLPEYLKERGIVAISGVDTREIASIIRKEGTMKAAISDKKDYPLTKTAPKYEGKRDTAKAENEKYTAAVIDLGLKNSTKNELLSRGVSLKIFPKTVTAEELLNSSADFIVLSSGAEGEFDYEGVINTAKKLFGIKPILAIGLGHLILSCSLGADIVKLKSGHRGDNYPVKQADSEKAYITHQNHSYVAENLKQGKVEFYNVNDNSVEGVIYSKEKSLSVAFYPKTSEDPRSTGFIYDMFLDMIGGGK